jgi:hypothetical protein
MVKSGMYITGPYSTPALVMACQVLLQSQTTRTTVTSSLLETLINYPEGPLVDTETFKFAGVLFIHRTTDGGYTVRVGT